MELYYLIPLALIIFAIAAIFFVGKKGKLAEHTPYDSRKYLLTPAELAFYSVLLSGVPDDHTLVSKVRVSDLLAVRKGLDRSRRQAALNKIIAKHVDFVVCKSADMSVVAAIELDDASHSRSDRIKRDAFVDSAFKSADIPLIRFRAQKQYDVDEISQTLQAHIFRVGLSEDSSQFQHSALTLPEAPNVTSDTIETAQNSIVQNAADPDCPKCGSSMLLRKAKRGDHKGTHFWGCSTFPKCKAVVRNPKL